VSITYSYYTILTKRWKLAAAIADDFGAQILELMLQPFRLEARKGCSNAEVDLYTDIHTYTHTYIHKLKVLNAETYIHTYSNTREKNMSNI
jgi:hypothetical protein